MRTPSLRLRVTAIGMVTFAVLLVLVNVALYEYLHRQLDDTVQEVLAARADIAESLGRGRTASQLYDGLESAGIPATVREADGTERQTSPLTVRAGASPAVSPGLPLAPRISRVVTFDDGTSIEVFATLAGVRATLRDLALGQTAISLLALAVAGLMLRRAGRVALEPLDTVVATADRIAAGDIRGRLNPDRESTELGRMAVSFDRMLDALEQSVTHALGAEEASRRFLADAAHQLRTPVAALHASADALLHERDPERRDRIVGNCLRETRRLGRLLRSLLLVARLDQGEVPSAEPVDVAAMVRDEVERSALLAPDLEVAVTVDGQTQDPATVPGDGDALREAIANILDNARRHARSRVTVSLTHRPDVLWVRIRDDGPGLAPDHVERAFQRFSSLDGAGGSGLGLPIARAIAESHGGSLDWSEGAFRLALPRSRSSRAR